MAACGSAQKRDTLSTKIDVQWLRLIRFQDKVCTKILQVVLEEKSTRKWKDKIRHSNDFKHVLANHEVRLLIKERCKNDDQSKEIWQVIYGGIYPQIDVKNSSRLEEYDITTCYWLIRKGFMCHIEADLKKHIEKIKDYRNDSFHKRLPLAHKSNFDDIFDELVDSVLSIQAYLMKPIYTRSELEEMKTDDLNACQEDNTDDLIERMEQLGVPVPDTPKSYHSSEVEVTKKRLQLLVDENKLSRKQLEDSPQLRSEVERDLRREGCNNDPRKMKDGCLEMTIYCRADKEIPEKGEVEWLSKIMTKHFLTKKVKKFGEEWNDSDDLYVKVMVKRCELKNRSEIEDPSLLLFDDEKESKCKSSADEKAGYSPDMVKEVTIIADYAFRSVEKMIEELARKDYDDNSWSSESDVENETERGFWKKKKEEHEENGLGQKRKEERESIEIEVSIITVDMYYANRTSSC